MPTISAMISHHLKEAFNMAKDFKKGKRKIALHPMLNSNMTTEKLAGKSP